jgi:hypothetical protein
MLLLLVVALAGQAGGETRTTCVRQDARTMECKSESRSPDLGGYSRGLAAGQDLVPDYQEQRRAAHQAEQLRLQNEVLRRQLEVQAAPGYDRKQCRRSAKGALDVDDLRLARDILTACAGAP